MRYAFILLLVATLAACANLASLGQQVCPNRWFDEADVDRNRTVTRAEYDAWRATCLDCVTYAGWFASGDANGDGMVTLGETCGIRGVPYASPSPTP